jgi:hypothetical protein
MPRGPIVAVLFLAAGLVTGTLYGSQASSVRAAIPHVAAKQCPQSKALITLASRGDVGVQDDFFYAARGPITIRWDAYRANPSTHNFGLTITLFDAANYTLYSVTTDKPGKGASTVYHDCSRRCHLFAQSTINTDYTVTVSQ